MDMEENYLILKAKKAQATDPSAAKAWILTAKTLYPNNFGVQVMHSPAMVSMNEKVIFCLPSFSSKHI